MQSQHELGTDDNTQHLAPSDDNDDANARWLRQQTQAVGTTMQRDYDPKSRLVIQRGQGAYVWDVAGKRFIDLTCGYSTTNFGHGFPPLVAAATEQLSRLTHLTGQPHPGQILLAQRLLAVLGIGPQGRVVFNSTGARAIETAWRAAVAFRPGTLLCLAPGFHGKSLAVEALSQDSGQLADALRMQPPVVDALPASQRRPSVEYPYCQRCPLDLKMPACQLRCADTLFETIEREAASISAVLVEPALGARGYIFPPDAYFRQLRELTRRFGILMIADEVQTGLGRCGDYSLAQRQGWQPDLFVFGKSLGGGIAPVSAVVADHAILNSLDVGAASETFAATPLACAVGLEVLNQLESGTLMRDADHAGQQLRNFGAQRIAGTYAIADGIECEILVSGRGANCAFEFRSVGGLELDQGAAKRFAEACLQSGLLVHYSGPYRTRVVLLPPLNISPAQLAEVQQGLLSAKAHWSQAEKPSTTSP